MFVMMMVIMAMVMSVAMIVVMRTGSDHIFMPLAKPALATIALWTAVMHWNMWFDGLIYVVSDEKQVLQVVLQRFVVMNDIRDLQYGIHDLDPANYSPESIKAATVVVTVLPILLVYPFLQRYFMKGITLGAVKE